MVFLNQLIDPMQEILRQGSVKANSFTQIWSYIEINYSPNSTGVVRITQIDVYFLRLWERITIGYQTFKVKSKRFLHVF